MYTCFKIQVPQRCMCEPGLFCVMCDWRIATLDYVIIAFLFCRPVSFAFQIHCSAEKITTQTWIVLGRDILCTDKTGTLTVDEVTFLKAVDVAGNDDLNLLKLAYANSRFQVRRHSLLQGLHIKRA